MLSNARPEARYPLCLSLSKDGLVYQRMAVIDIPEKINKSHWYARKGYLHSAYEAHQYPHAMEHDGSLMILFSRRKQKVESLKISLEHFEKLWI